MLTECQAHHANYKKKRLISFRILCYPWWTKRTGQSVNEQHVVRGNAGCKSSEFVLLAWIPSAAREPLANSELLKQTGRSLNTALWTKVKAISPSTIHFRESIPLIGFDPLCPFFSLAYPELVRRWLCAPVSVQWEAKFTVNPWKHHQCRLQSPVAARWTPLDLSPSRKSRELNPR